MEAIVVAEAKDGDSLERGEKGENWMRVRGGSETNSAPPGNGERAPKRASPKEEPDVRSLTT